MSLASLEQMGLVDNEVIYDVWSRRGSFEGVVTSKIQEVTNPTNQSSSASQAEPSHRGARK